MTFGERLKQLRAGAGLSQAQLAHAAAIGVQTLKDYEGNRRGPSFEIAQRLCKALGQSCEVFDGCEFQHTSRPEQSAATEEVSPKPRGGGKAKKQGKRKNPRT